MGGSVARMLSDMVLNSVSFHGISVSWHVIILGSKARWCPCKLPLCFFCGLSRRSCLHHSLMLIDNIVGPWAEAPSCPMQISSYFSFLCILVLLRRSCLHRILR